MVKGGPCMKKMIACVLCVLLVLLPLGVLAGAQEAQSKFLVLGDSIAAGSGVSDKADAYAWLIAEAKGYDLTNYGAGGDISADLLRKVTEQENTRRKITEADIIAVSIGGNDLLHAEDVFTMVIKGLLGDYDMIQPVLDTFRENYAGIIAGIRALNPHALVVVQTLYNPAFPLPSLRAAYGAAIEGLNAIILEHHALDPQAYVIADVYAAFAPARGAVFVDMTHPSARGHSIIAAVLMNTIDASLSQQTQTPVPGGIVVLNAMAYVFGPVLTVLDWVLIGGMLRVLYGIIEPIVGFFA